MNTLLPAPVLTVDDLKSMSLADCPDYATAVAAGIAHGLAPKEALKSAHMQWAKDHADAVQAFGLGNFYDGPDANRLMMDLKAYIQFLCIRLADQEQQLADLNQKLLDR